MQVINTNATCKRHADNRIRCLLRTAGWRRLLPDSGARVRRLAYENGCGAGHVVAHGGGGVAGVTGFDRVDDLGVSFDVHVFQGAVDPGVHDGHPDAALQ